MRGTKRLIAPIALLLAVMTTVAYGQVDQGKIQGVVKDMANKQRVPKIAMAGFLLRIGLITTYF